MGWEIHPARTAFATFATDWDRLNEELHSGHPMFDSRFVGSLLDCFGDGKEALCIFRHEKTVVGALILQPDKIGHWSSFRPSQAQAISVLMRNAGPIASLFDALPGFTWSIALYAVDPRFAPDFSRLGLVKVVSKHTYTIGIHPDLNFEKYWTQRSKNLRSNVRKYLNRAEREGVSLRLSASTDHADMGVKIQRFSALESAGWKGKEGTAVSFQNNQGKFYSGILADFATSNQAVVYELIIGEELAASLLVIFANQMTIFLKTTYEESLSRFAPGRLLLYLAIQEELSSRPTKAIEFYTNASRELAEWTTFGCAIQNVQIFRDDFSAACFSVLKAFQRQLRSAKNRREPKENLAQIIEAKVAPDIPTMLRDGYELAEFADPNSIEHSADWFELIQNHVYRDDPDIRFYFVADKQLPGTIVPLRFSRTGNVKTIESLGNYYTSLYAPLQSHENKPFVLREILAAATRDHGGAHVMRFAPMDRSAPVYQTLIDELQAIGWVTFRFFCFGNWFLKAPETWDEYLKQRSGNLRSSIRRRSKQFAAEGGALEVVTSSDDIDAAIAAFQQVYMASWKVPEPHPEFVPSLIRRLATLGMLRLGIARLQGRPIAAQLWIVGQDKASIYKVAYHEDFAAYSPGTVLTAHLMQHVIDQDHVKEVDFLIGDDKYKQIWMSDRRERWGIVAYNPRTLIGFALLLKEVLARTTKTLRTRIKDRLRRADRSVGLPHRKASSG